MRDRILYVSNAAQESSEEDAVDVRKDRMLYVANPGDSGSALCESPVDADEDRGRPVFCGIYGISRAYSFDGGSGDAEKRRARLLQLANADPVDNDLGDDERVASPESSVPTLLPYLNHSPRPAFSPSDTSTPSESPSELFSISNFLGLSAVNDEPNSASLRAGRRRRRLPPFTMRNTPRRLGTLPPRHTSESHIISPAVTSSPNRQDDGISDEDWVPVVSHRYSHKHSYSTPLLTSYPDPQDTYFPSPPPNSRNNTYSSFHASPPPASSPANTHYPNDILHDVFNISASKPKVSRDEVQGPASRSGLKFIRNLKSALFKTPTTPKSLAPAPLITTFLNPPTVAERVSVVVMSDPDHYHIVDIGGSPDGRIIRKRILTKLNILDEPYTYAICRPGGGGISLTDEQLFALCREEGDSKGSLGFFMSPFVPRTNEDTSQSINDNDSPVLPKLDAIFISPSPIKQRSTSREDSEPQGSKRSRREMKQPSSGYLADTENPELGFHQPPVAIERPVLSSLRFDLPSTTDDLPSTSRSREPSSPWRLPSMLSPHLQQDAESKPKYFSRLADQTVYLNLASFLASSISTDYENDHILWDEFQEYLDRVATMDRVLCLAESDLCRSRLLEFSTRLGLSGSPAIRKALESDEESLVVLLKEIMDSKPAKETVLLLKDDTAYSFLDFLQWVISRGFLDPHGATKKARRLFVKLSLKADIILPSQLITGLTLLNNGEPVNGGGYADIFRATYQGKEVAVKRIRAHLGKDSQKVRRAFAQEALVWRHLKHPNVLPFLGIDSEMFTSSLCMVSPWMKNGTIMDFRAANGPSNINIEQRLIEISDGLSYLHTEGVIHGDLRGGNILIDDDWHAVLADFGLTTFGDATMSATNETNARGTTRWMAPELLVPEADEINGLRKTQASDVYALGCVCLELYTGRPPFSETKNETAVVCLLVQGKRPSVETLSREAQVFLPGHIKDLVEKCWKLSPKERPGSLDVVRVLKKADN